MTTITPMSQALAADAPIGRAELKALMRRSDATGLLWLAGWLALLGATGTLVWLALGTWWLLPAMFLHGIVVVHHFALQHECCHMTAFRTRRLSKLVGAWCGFVLVIPPTYFKYEHCDHHTHTNIPGRDPELIGLPQSLWAHVVYISSLSYWKSQFSILIRTALGRFDETERRFIPKEERDRVIREGRLMVAGYLAVIAAMLAFAWSAPLWFWFIPMFIGQPVMRAIRMTEHVGRPQVRDLKQNTRTTLVSWPWRFVAWNANYHAEHHFASSVPFHALPRLHARLKGQLAHEPGGYLAVHAEILRQVRAAAA